MIALPQLQSDPSLGQAFALVLSKDGVFHSFQGEGPRQGKPTTFMRLAACNLACTWCDTSYTWDFRRWEIQKEALSTPLQEVVNRLVPLTIPSLTVTGGEPLLQWSGLKRLFNLLPVGKVSEGYEEINFETNGTIWPEWGYHEIPYNYVVSPKLKNSGNAILDSKGATPRLIATLARFVRVGADFKFVCEGPADLDEVDQLIKVLWEWEATNLLPKKVWVMPQGVEPGVINNRAQALAAAVLERKWNLTTRLHISLWGPERAK